MHRTIGYLSKRFVQIRPGEGRKVTFTFLYFFLIITAYYLIKPASRSLVLGELGSRMVPYVDLICAVLMGPIVTLFARLVDRVPKPRLVSGSFWFVIGILVLFWKLLAWPVPWVAGAFYVWVSIFSVLVVTLFWLVANDLYRPQEAKRLFGFIGSGGILGGIVGSSIAAVGAQVIGTENLILVSSALLVGCWLSVEQLWTLAPERAYTQERAPGPARHDTFLHDFGSFVRLLLQSRYLLLLVALVSLTKLVSTLIYYQFNPFIELQFPDADAKTTFTSVFFGGMNVVAFIVQFFFTSWILRRWGMMTALLVLPVGVLCGTAGLLVLPVFWVAAATELYDGSLNYSLQQTSKEVLYLPIDRSIRYKVKPFIDMVVFRFGKGIAAIIGIVLLDALHWPSQVLSYVSVPLIAAWLVVAVKLRRDYVATIRTVLQARAASRLSPRPAADDGRGPPRPAVEAARPGEGGHAVWEEEWLVPFQSLTGGQASSRKLVLVDRLLAARSPASTHAKELLQELHAYEARLAPPSEFEAAAHRLKAVISDQQMPMAKRRQAVRLLSRAADQATVDYLLGMVMVEEDAALRQEAVRGLVRLRLKGKRLEFPERPIRRQIAYEVTNSQRIIQVATIVRQHHRGSLASDDPVIALLRALTEESVEQVFCLLMLLYRPEDIHLVYEQLRAPDTYVRADAIELLDNLIDPAMRLTIFPILDEERFLALFEQGTDDVREPTAAYRALQEAIWDHNHWLSVTTLCAVGWLRMTTMRQELERASRHTMPVISKAAKAALHLSTLP
ncbi:MAG: MFS transporter [Candidatus Omnitrophica bacterium]|nr:MFS transporter [Candidatus Omnitrophota bacterium]